MTHLGNYDAFEHLMTHLATLGRNYDAFEHLMTHLATFWAIMLHYDAFGQLEHTVTHFGQL
jgi:hypothetical protein